jgi:hypothetical protein
MASVADKQQMYQLWNRGLFGNRPQVWFSYEDYRQSGFRGPIMLRYQVQQSQYCSEVTTYDEVPEVISGWIKRGANPALVTYGEALLQEGRIFQGEVLRSERYLELTYSEQPLVMRAALAADPHYAHGIRALALLRLNLPPQDIDWIFELFDRWPDCAVEFTTFNRPVGNLRGKTVIWEVREY